MEKKDSVLLGIDLGGTKIEGVVLNRNDFNIQFRERIPTEADLGYEHIIERIAFMVEHMTRATKSAVSAIGIGTPGVSDPVTGLMKNSNTTALIGKPFKKDLENRIGMSVEMANDANCFALAEAVMGVVPQQMESAQVVFGVIMGTGVGGGIVVNGKVLNGAQGIAGEWGHNFLDSSGGKDYAGLDGCVETILSGPALERWYKERSGQEKYLKEIVIDYRKEVDPIATKTIERLIHFFGKAIAPVINLLDPDAIVLGGGVSNIDELYSLGVEEVKKYVFNNRFDTKILRPKLGDSAGVFGAALLTK